MTITQTITGIIAQLEAMNVSDDLAELWQATFDAAENFAVALDHDDEPTTLPRSFYAHEGTWGEFRA
jgi:hypothetical protein